MYQTVVLAGFTACLTGGLVVASSFAAPGVALCPAAEVFPAIAVFPATALCPATAATAAAAEVLTGVLTRWVDASATWWLPDDDMQNAVARPATGTAAMDRRRAIRTREDFSWRPKGFLPEQYTLTRKVRPAGMPA